MASGIYLITWDATVIRGTSVVVHTVPAGISYQVVHLKWDGLVIGGTARASLNINGEPYFIQNYGAVPGTTDLTPTSAPLVLLPGDVISISCTNTSFFDSLRYNLLISGYEVP
jgi:hypothetical protein